jgi:hypothetical protein
LTTIHHYVSSTSGILLLRKFVSCRSRSAATPSPSTMYTAARGRRRRACSTSAWRRWWRGCSRATTPPFSHTARSGLGSPPPSHVRQSFCSHVPLMLPCQRAWTTTLGPKASSTACGAAAGTEQQFFALFPLPAVCVMMIGRRVREPKGESPIADRS